MCGTVSFPRVPFEARQNILRLPEIDDRNARGISHNQMVK